MSSLANAKIARIGTRSGVASTQTLETLEEHGRGVRHSGTEPQ